MSEPEELIIEGAHFATRVGRAAWRRYGARSTSQTVTLSSVRSRLELFLTGLFGRSLDVAAMDPAAPRTWLMRLANRQPQGTMADSVRSGTDGCRIFLPAALDHEHAARGRSVFSGQPTTAGRGTRPRDQRREVAQPMEDAVALYRLLAVQQAIRLVRGTVGVASGVRTQDVRAWFLLAEAAVADSWIAREVPGLLDAIRAARVDALDRRKGNHDHAFERQLCALLASDPQRRVLGIEESASVAESLRWAQRVAAAVGSQERHQRVLSVWYWGSILEPAGSIPIGRTAWDEQSRTPGSRPRVAEMRRRPRFRDADQDDDDSGSGTWVVRADDPQESVEDPFGLQRPADHEEHADPDGLADSLSDLPETRVVRTPGQVREVLRSGETVPREDTSGPLPTDGRGISYPEWDFRTRLYREAAAIVREPAARLGDSGWVRGALSRHSGLARRVRVRFARLQPRPVRLPRQLDGPEVDLGAYVTATADARAGATLDGRIYVAVRPARRELAVALLVDTSASTDAWVSTAHRIIDVEKEALLVVCEALDALGDRYAVFAFSGEGSRDVSVLTLKRFDERVGTTVRRRIAALDSDRYTRLGAPLRHVTAALCRQPAGRRLLLVLSDGKPNDVDLYEGRYGVEDTRQAVAEARRQGVAVFCLTVDREAPRYAARIFGQAGFAVLHRAEQLPRVLIDVLRQLIRQ